MKARGATEFPSPLSQQIDRVSPNHVVCNEGLELIMKNNGQAACVKPETKEKLIERGWIKNECARLFDSNMNAYSNHAKEQREKVVWTPPTPEGLVLKADYFEEWRNYECIDTINDWKHLSENTRFLKNLDLDELK